VNSPFDMRDVGDNAGDDSVAANRDAGPRPGTFPTQAGPEWVIRTVRPPRDGIAEFHRRLFELTPRVLVTRTIVAANLVAFALMAFSSGALLSPDVQTLIAWGANFGPRTLSDQWWRLLTCMFVHVGIIHIAFNMWVLWDAGHLVERLVGNVGFLVLYLISGLFGSIASVYWNPHVVSAGASGAVFGVFGALIGFIMLRRDSVPSSVFVRLRSSGLAFLGYNLVFGFAIKFIDNAAHIGGLAAGFVCGVLMSHPLDRVTGTSRAVRNLLAIAVAIVGLLVALHIAPDAPSDVLGRLEAFSETERLVLDRHQAAWSRWQSGELGDDEFIGIVQSEVLRPWREARQQLDQLHDVPPSQRQFVTKLRQYVKAREEAWEALLLAVREPTAIKMQEYTRKNDAADEVLKELNSQ